MDKYIGKKLDGRYEILELVGVGGMANVYKAHDAIEDRIVAVKILRDEFLSNEEFLRRFKNESKAISVLSHQNIVKIYDVSFNEKVNSIVMEYIDGITLKEYIEQQKVLNWKETVHFTVQILRALQHAHDRGIIHRDIKPQNIMLLQDGTIKVTDFGIARFTRSETRTITDKAIGSVHYISPEQAYGKSVDGRSDIYSVGIMLYEMLTGRLPFEADSAVSVALQQIQVTAIKPREINPDIPNGLEQITLKAMEKDNNRRFNSAAEMLRYLEEFKKNTAVQFDALTAKPDTGATKLLDKKKKETPEKQKKKQLAVTNTIIDERSPAISIVSGVATGFVISVILFILAIILIVKPFAPVPNIKAPNLSGLTLEEAQRQYPNLKFNVEDERYVIGFAPGEIYEQNPRPDSEIKATASVNVKISLGTQLKKIPDLTNEDSTIAISLLKSYGFDTHEVKDFSNTVAENCVIKTIPEHGQEVAVGSTIQVYVSMGSDQLPVSVPDLYGYTVEEATEILAANGLEIGTITPVQSTRPEGTIVQQSPSQSSQISPGGRINVNISSGASQGVGGTPIQLPIKIHSNSTTPVQIQCTVNDTVLASETIIPAEMTTWTPTIQGVGSSRVKVLYNGMLYQEYLVDFSTGFFIVSADNSQFFSSQD